ncbi:MAG: aromatic ring-hydroxylating dioxygenase subunit alpha [Anaerolineales bacterium]|jgi:phenylpropionate dioxygenase-like ring-hydroxylating dioxygenase large terminal subunit
MVNDPVLINEWHAVARSEDVQQGSIRPARLLEEDLVLWRLDGEVSAWKDLCLHRGTRLSLGSVEDDLLVCPYHGWTYNWEGQCVRMPAHPDQKPSPRARLQRYHTREMYGLIWVCLGEPKTDVPPFPEWEDPSFRKIICGPYFLKAAGPRAIENFLDVAHFPYVHEGLLGQKDHPEIEDYEVEVGPEGVAARNVRVWQPDPDGSGSSALVTYTYQAFRPLTAYFTKTSGGPRFSAFFTINPLSELASESWLLLALNYRHDVPEQELRDFEDRIMAQDIPIVESQRPELLPLDLQVELHLRSDRTAIAYRKWLRSLGLTFGTA